MPSYVRQLRDRRGSIDLRRLTSGTDLEQYGALCGRALARAHARSGPAGAIAAALGGGAFDVAIGAFATAYADQTERSRGTVRRHGFLAGRRQPQRIS